MATLSTLVVKLVGDIGGFVDEMKRAEGEAKKAGGGISGALSSALGGIGNVAKIAAGATVAAIGAATTAAIGGVAAFTSWGQKLDSLGDVLGTSANESAALAVAIRTVGGDVDAITGQMAKFARGLETSKGKLGPTGELMKSLGIKFKDANGNLLPTTKILEAVANKLSAMPDGLEKTALMTDLFGKSGKDLSDTLNALANGGLAAAEDKARAFGLAIGEEGVNQSIAFGKSWETVKLAIEGFVVSIGLTVMPVILPLIQKLAEWAQVVMPQVRVALENVFSWITTNVVPIVEEAGRIIQKVFGGDFQGAIEGLQTIWERIAPSLQAAWETFWGTTVPAAWEGFKVIFQASWNEFWGTTVPAAWNTLKMIFQIAWDTFWGVTVPAAWTTFKQVFQIAWDVFWGVTVPAAWNSLKQIFLLAWATFWNITVPKAWESFKMLFQMAWDTFWGTTVPAAWTTFKMAFQIAWDGFWGGLGDAVKNIIKEIERIWNEFLDGLRAGIGGLGGVVEGAMPDVYPIQNRLAPGMNWNLAIPAAAMPAAGGAAGSNRYAFEAGSIVVQAAPYMSPDMIAQAVLDEAARRADGRMRMK